MKKFLTIVALTLAVIPLGSSSAPSNSHSVATNPAVKTRASLITPEVLAEIAAPVSPNVQAAAKISIENVKTVDDARVWIYQTCPAVKVAMIPGKASFYLPKNSAIAVGSETEGKYLPFVIAHEMSHHYQWVENGGDLAIWNEGMRPQESLPPKLEVQADYMAAEVIGSLPAIANYAKQPANPEELKEAIRVSNFGKSKGC